jgi:hypothetical protein
VARQSTQKSRNDDATGLLVSAVPETCAALLSVWGVGLQGPCVAASVRRDVRAGLLVPTGADHEEKSLEVKDVRR